MNVICQKLIKLVLFLNILFFNACSVNTSIINTFEQKYDFDRVDHIRVATWFEEEKPLNEVIDSFHERFPHVQVELVLYPSQSYDQYIDEIIDDEKGIDVILFPSLMNYASLTFENHLLNLKEWLDEDEVDLSVFGTLLNSINTEDDLYGLPYRNSVFLLYYNKTLFDQAGIDYPSKDMTWDMFYSKAKALTRGEGNDKIWGTFLQSYVQLWTIQSLQNGYNFLDDDLSSFEKSLQFSLNLVENDLMLKPAEIDARDLIQNGSIKFFGNGKVAMMPMGEWTAWQLIANEEIDFEWAVTKMPYPMGGRRDVSIGNMSIASVLNHSQSKEMAFEFIKSLSGPSGAKIYASAGSIPAIVNEETREIYLKNTNPNLSLHFFLETQTESISPYHQKSAEIVTLFKDTFEDVLDQKLSIDEAMDFIYQERLRIFKD